jgi:hypothetical protein
MLGWVTDLNHNDSIRRDVPNIECEDVGLLFLFFQEIRSMPCRDGRLILISSLLFLLHSAYHVLVVNECLEPAHGCSIVHSKDVLRFNWP